MTKMIKTNCDTPLPDFSNNPCDCNYVTPAIKSIKIKKDKHGNYLVQVNGDRKWRGATLDKETKTTSFSY